VRVASGVWAAVAVLVAAAALARCSEGGTPRGAAGPSASAPSGPAAAPTPGPTSAPGGAGACPRSPLPPDPDRPAVTLTFAVAPDLASVRGTEEVRFRPDLPVDELVFRLTPNSPNSTRQGTSLRVTAARVRGPDGTAGGEFTFERAGADPATQGGLLVVPLPHTARPGEEVSARVQFTLTLGGGGFERFGHGRGVAWWGSGQPLLAWERGVGWHREPLLGYPGESATSEAARTDLTVVAPATATVLSSGVQDPPRDTGQGLRSWHATAGTARDVSVAVGDLRTTTLTVGTTRITVGAAGRRPPQDLLDDLRLAVTELSRRFGPFPYPALNVTLLPFGGGGIEYPGSILLLGQDRVTTVHEVAHEWFYGMVGDSQARDPWLDEAFASYAEYLVDGRKPAAGDLGRSGRVGASTEEFGSGRRYFPVVYGKGAAALLAARDAAGPERFDAALRCYVNANAWRIARPQDLARALAGLPRALAVLREAGAL
jgi:hypothetical protein